MTILRPIAALLLSIAGAFAGLHGHDGAPHGDGSHGRPPRAAAPLSFDARALAQLNGTAPQADATQACGSNTQTFLTELFNVAPTDVKVNEEWGDIVPGKQVAIEGPVRTTHLGPTDLPLTHIFGDDLSMDVGLPTSLQPFAQHLGPSSDPADQMHVEIASGLIPHSARPSPASTDQTWRQASDFDLSGILDDFASPAIGDPALVMGRWIIDCGHGDYGTELHPMSFLAWSHTAGEGNTVHAYMNPYRDSQRYGPDASTLGSVNDSTRFTNPDVKPFVPYLIDEVLRVLSGATDRLRAQQLLEAIKVAPPPWTVCAPAGSKGPLRIASDIVTRPGVHVDMWPDHAQGCVTVRITLSDRYEPMDQPVRLCQLPWDYLNAIASDSVGRPVDVRALFSSLLPADAAAKVTAHDPVVTCADPLVAPAVDPSPRGNSRRVDASQPFPFYGIVRVTRGR